MDVIETNTQEKMPRGQFPRILFRIGVPIVLLNVAFALRVAWEQTFLTWRSGPQMMLGHDEVFLALIGFYGFFMGLPWALMTLAQMISTRSYSSIAASPSTRRRTTAAPRCTWPRLREKAGRLPSCSHVAPM